MASFFEKIFNCTMDTPTRPGGYCFIEGLGSGRSPGAGPRLIPHVYAELRRMSRRYMKEEQPGHTLQATALGAHDVYLKLVDLDSVDWKDRAHFYGVCAQMMRRIPGRFRPSAPVPANAAWTGAAYKPGQCAGFGGNQRQGTGGAGRRDEHAGTDGSPVR